MTNQHNHEKSDEGGSGKFNKRRQRKGNNGQ